ncbi:hypothetical protein T492DRAFT_1027376 [Pavlovales sp. CCMP2436]|nr:hypothetical protein T492DRAFT_1027376 [Pavlovales sp. CCMP2436]
MTAVSMNHNDSDSEMDAAMRAFEWIEGRSASSLRAALAAIRRWSQPSATIHTWRVRMAERAMLALAARLARARGARGALAAWQSHALDAQALMDRNTCALRRWRGGQRAQACARWRSVARDHDLLALAARTLRDPLRRRAWRAWAEFVRWRPPGRQPALAALSAAARLLGVAAAVACWAAAARLRDLQSCRLQHGLRQGVVRAFRTLSAGALVGAALARRARRTASRMVRVRLRQWRRGAIRQAVARRWVGGSSRIALARWSRWCSRLCAPRLRRALRTWHALARGTVPAAEVARVHRRRGCLRASFFRLARNSCRKRRARSHIGRARARARDWWTVAALSPSGPVPPTAATVRAGMDAADALLLSARRHLPQLQSPQGRGVSYPPRRTISPSLSAQGGTPPSTSHSHAPMSAASATDFRGGLEPGWRVGRESEEGRDLGTPLAAMPGWVEWPRSLGWHFSSAAVGAGEGPQTARELLLQTSPRLVTRAADLMRSQAGVVSDWFQSSCGRPTPAFITSR